MEEVFLFLKVGYQVKKNMYDNLIIISDDDAETDDDRLEFHADDLELI